MFSPIRLACFCVAALLLAGPALAQEEDEAPPDEPDTHAVDLAPHTQVDIGDLWHMLLHQEPMTQTRSNGSLEERFLQVVGADQFERQKLSWLEGER